MARTELGFLALPQFLKGTPELSILPSLPPLDPVAGVTGRRQGMGRLFPRRPPDWWCRGSRLRRRLGKGWLALVPALEGLFGLFASYKCLILLTFWRNIFHYLRICFSICRNASTARNQFGVIPRGLESLSLRQKKPKSNTVRFRFLSFWHRYERILSHLCIA